MKALSAYAYDDGGKDKVLGTQNRLKESLTHSRNCFVQLVISSLPVFVRCKTFDRPSRPGPDCGL